MTIINLKKRKKTTTTNINYDIIPTLTGNKNLKPIGNYNQSSNTLAVNVETLILLISKGASFSTNFKQIFNRGTNLLTNKKTIKIKY